MRLILRVCAVLHEFRPSRGNAGNLRWNFWVMLRIAPNAPATLRIAKTASTMLHISKRLWYLVPDGGTITTWWLDEVHMRERMWGKGPPPPNDTNSHWPFQFRAQTGRNCHQGV